MSDQKITLDPAKASIDGVGVQRWRFPLENGGMLSVYKRPREYLTRPSDPPFMLRVEGAAGEHVHTRYARAPGTAIHHAEQLARDATNA